jgi:hypothetical protein
MTRFTPWILLLLAIPAVYCIIVIQLNNGTLELLNKLETASPLRLPRSSENVRQFYTGISPVDAKLQSLVIFFWNVVDGHYPPIALFGIYMSGQLICVHLLVLLEGYRRANSKKATSLLVSPAVPVVKVLR